MHKMKEFHSGREAKEFLISRIVLEAQRENIPLSEVERKMLYFTESGWTLPDMTAVSEDFDRDYSRKNMKRKLQNSSEKLPSTTTRNPVKTMTRGGPLSVF